uniref:Ribosome receptor lysine/proline rich domain-containing protein n=1 Tax=Mola mola TaxID=94237 RepID=A0A3Q3W616_MOLML
MDIYDPQTLGIMVFGGFMVISAVGIALVSTFSMKETSYEEALAKQRSELGKTQSARADKKKKDKISEKKSRGKKKEDKPNGKIPESEKNQEDAEADAVIEPAAAPVVAAAPAPAPEPVPALQVKPTPVPANTQPKAAAEPSPAVPEPSPAPSPKDKKKKKVAKVEPASMQSAPLVSSPAPVKSSAVPPLTQTPPVSASTKSASTSAKAKNASASVKSAPAPAASKPTSALVSTIRSMVFSEGEAHRLIEILSEKAGIIQDTWHMATQKGDPVAILKKQLEEKEKQLAAEQEDSSTARNRLRELAKELSAEKSKVANVETRLSSQLSKREQEMIALQARMQASYQDHVAQSQALNAKILSLQDQLEKGPNAQLARLQQENSILRDALNQATSQAESKQNAELAKLRQECTKLTKDLGEKTDSLLAEEHIRKGLEAKVSATEKQLSLLQVDLACSEQTLQRRLEEVSEELRTTQSRNGSLQATLDKTQQDSNQNIMGELSAFQTETKETLQTIFPQIPIETEQSNWLQVFTQKAQEALSHQNQESQSSTALPLLEKLKEAKESQGSLQAECEQYRTVLAETEGMLKHLQMSVEEEELVWKSKMANSEEQLRLVKEQMMLLEAQLEKQSDSQGASEEMEQVPNLVNYTNNFNGGSSSRH